MNAMFFCSRVMRQLLNSFTCSVFKNCPKFMHKVLFNHFKIALNNCNRKQGIDSVIKVYFLYFYCSGNEMKNK